MRRRVLQGPRQPAGGSHAGDPVQLLEVVEAVQVLQLLGGARHLGPALRGDSALGERVERGDRVELACVLVLDGRVGRTGKRRGKGGDSCGETNGSDDTSC